MFFKLQSKKKHRLRCMIKIRDQIAIDKRTRNDIWNSDGNKNYLRRSMFSHPL